MTPAPTRELPPQRPRPQPPPGPFTHRLRVRYAECDQQGVVFNGHYLFFYDVAITELWREALGGHQAMLRDGVDMVVAETRLRFLAGAHFDDEIDITLAVAHIGTTSLRVGTAFRRGDEVLADGEMRHVFVRVDGGGKAPIPDGIRAALARYRGPDATTGRDGPPGT